MTGSVSALFEPRNIVIMGASDRNWSVRVHGNLARLGFPGAVHLVNPNRKELWGQPCYASLSELPEAPDHLAIFLPADDTIAAIDSAGEYGARSASLCASSGSSRRIRGIRAEARAGIMRGVMPEPSSAIAMSRSRLIPGNMTMPAFMQPAYANRPSSVHRRPAEFQQRLRGQVPVHQPVRQAWVRDLGIR